MLNQKTDKNIVLSAIVAVDKNNAIGKNNSIPWRVPSDLKYFKEKTMGHHLIMGRKTYDSIGKPLPGRMIIVITRDLGYTASGSIVVHSFEEAIDQCPKDEEVFVVGGEQIYKGFWDILDILYITEIDTVVEQPDAYFENPDPKDWLLIRDIEPDTTPKDMHKFYFKTYIKGDVIAKNIGMKDF